jgi:hypothetical protein
MVTTIMVTIIGCHVFPDHTGWWILYCVVVGTVKLIASLLSGLKSIGVIN